MSSLERDLSVLEADLVARPMRISAYHDLPFAIFRYEPRDEFRLRARLRLFAIGLEENHGKRVRFVSLARLVWRIAEACQGLDYLYRVEQFRGFDAAQDHLRNLMRSPQFRPIANEVLAEIDGLDPERDLVFLVRAGGFAPRIYRASVLLNELHQRTMVPMVLFYPGSAQSAADLSFYNLPGDAGLGGYNYRVKVYGVDA